MRGIIWLASGLILSLLLVSGISADPQFSRSGNFFATQDLKFIGQAAGQALGKINQSLNSQFTFLNNSAAVVSTWDVISDWLYPLISWFNDLWLRFINAWKHFLGLVPAAPVAPVILNSNLSTSSDLAGPKYGIIVAPATGSTTRDELLKKNLSQMFADRVDLKFDPNGMSGVVTPVFKSGQRGADYIFILTPLR